MLTPLQFTAICSCLKLHNVSPVLVSHRDKSRKVKVIPSRGITSTKGKYRYGSTHLSPRQSMGLGGLFQAVRAEKEFYYPLHRKLGGTRVRSGQL